MLADGLQIEHRHVVPCNLKQKNNQSRQDEPFETMNYKMQIRRKLVCVYGLYSALIGSLFTEITFLNSTDCHSCAWWYIKGMKAENIPFTPLIPIMAFQVGVFNAK